VYREYQEPSTFQPVNGGASSVELFGEFPYAFEHGEGEASDELFAGQIVEGVCIPAEYDGR
jgi:hypothetical protein